MKAKADPTEKPNNQPTQQLTRTEETRDNAAPLLFNFEDVNGTLFKLVPSEVLEADARRLFPRDRAAYDAAHKGKP